MVNLIYKQSISIIIYKRVHRQRISRKNKLNCFSYTSSRYLCHPCISQFLLSLSNSPQPLQLTNSNLPLDLHLFTSILFHPLHSSSIHSNPLPLTPILFHSLLSSSTHSNPLPLTPILFHSLQSSSTHSNGL